MSHLDHTYAVILAGGGGTRLWPKSRTKTPKQFLKLFGTNTMMQMSANRISKLVPWERIIVVTNELYREEVKEQLPQVPENNILAEPAKRDTALAMLVGSLYAQSLDKDAVIINCASDHVVADEQEFVRVMDAASQVASEEDVLVTVGITPTRPATGFGYIRIGQDLKKLRTGNTLFKVDSFSEKPKEATARAYIATGKYFWNANMYVWKAETLRSAFKEHMPSLYEATQPLRSLTGKKFHAALKPIYAESEAISIDYAISEKASNLVLIPGDFGWDDVGDWKVVYDLEKKDLDGNVVVGDAEVHHTLAVHSHNNLIHTDDRLVALIGINDMIIIDTGHILMLAPKERSQDVKKLVERLKEENQDQYL